ncbi:Uncharacterised protein [Mycobacteroides abscessus subsp. abscessus]|nr:Uncharacterised protein [Mycobacteroides abscessus subsp. abscessus]
MDGFPGDVDVDAGHRAVGSGDRFRNGGEPPVDLDRCTGGMAVDRGIEEVAQRVELRVLARGGGLEVDTVEDVSESADAGEFADHHRIELRRARPRPADDVEAGDVGAQRPVDAVVEVAALECLVLTGEEADDVDGDVALADDGDTRAEGHGRSGRLVGVTVEDPGEGACPIDPVEVGSGHREVAVVGESAGEDDGIVVRPEVVHRDVAAEFGVADEAGPGVGEESVELRGHGLRALVVGGDTVAQQSVRYGKSVEDVDGAAGNLTEDLLRGEAARRSGADDGDLGSGSAVSARLPRRGGPPGDGGTVVGSGCGPGPRHRQREHAAEDPSADCRLLRGVDLEALQAVEEQRQGDVGDLGSGRPVAEADVDALAEGEVGLDLAMDVELLGLGPDGLIAVG